MKQEFKDFVTSLDILNTINGGISEPYISLRENPTGQEVHVRVPGTSHEGLQAEIVNNNELVVYRLLPVVSSGNLLQLPKVVYHHVVPRFIDVIGISSGWEESEFVVRLPFSALPDGNHRRITQDID